MKRFVLMLMLAIFTMPILSVQAMTQKEAGFISASANIVKEVEPDTASLSISVVTSAPTAQAAMKANNEKTEKLILALKSCLDLQKQDTISTTDISVKPVYNYEKGGKKRFVNYTMSNTIIVKVKNLKNVSNLIDIAVANNATSVSDVRFFVENENLYTQAMIREATQNAKSVAEAAASSVGHTVKGVKRIYVNCNQNFAPAVYGLARAKSMADTATPVEPKKVKMVVNVNADFYVK